MKPHLPRQVLVELVLGVAVCAGAAAMLVDPANKQIAQARQKAASLTNDLAAHSKPIVPAERAREVLQSADARIAALGAAGRGAADAASLYSAIMATAEKHSITVEQAQPSDANNSAARKKTTPDRAVPPPPDGEAPPPPPGEVKAISYVLAVKGTYADLASFLSSLQREVGLARIRSVRLDPVFDANPPAVRAIIESDHFWVELKDHRTAAAAQEPKP